MVLVLRDHYTQVNYVFQLVIIDRIIGAARHIDYFTYINMVVYLILTDSPKHKRHEGFYLILLTEKLGHFGVKLYVLYFVILCTFV